MFRRTHIAVLVLGLTQSFIHQAQADTGSEPASPLEEIKVVAHPLAGNGTAQPVTVLSGDALAREVQFSLGETLSGEAGIQSASFGTAVGRPIIHGLAGARVKTTEDRIDTLDVSVTSGDHAVGLEPLIANQVTVLRGSSTLLYGSGAIGGVVDVSTSRIQGEMIDDVTGRAQLSAADNANAVNGAFALDLPLAGSLMLHLDGFTNEADDFEIPGFAESAFQMAAEEAEEEHGEHEGDEYESGEHGHDEEEEVFGLLEGSRSERRGGAIGLSMIGDAGFVGFSISSLNADYGLVGGHAHAHEEEHEGEEHGEEEHGEEESEEPGMIDLAQTRFDVQAQLNNPFNGIESVNVRLGINDYEHNEFEPNGEVGTQFENDAWEGRVEFAHESWLGFDGAFGLQLGQRAFSAVGEEAFVPPVDSDTLGLFWVGQRDLASSELEAGVRVERVEHAPSSTGLPDLSFDLFSASLGLIKPINDHLTLSGMVDVSSRAPTAEELYSNGAHLATNAFEVGDPNLSQEDVMGVTLTAGYGSDRLELNTSLYIMQFDNYIYEIGTDQEIDELPVFLWQQDDATFTGANLSAVVHLAFVGGGDLDLNVMFDVVRGELGEGNANRNLPRIPAARRSVGLSWKSEAWEAGTDYLRVDNQRRVAGFELPTDSYEDLSVFIKRKFAVAQNEINVFLRGRNLTDDEQRHHGSIVKDFAPAPGRRWEVGIRMDF